MYNHHLEVRGRIRGHDDPGELRLAVNLAFQHIPGAKVVAYRTANTGSTLQLYWAEVDGITHLQRLPFDHGAPQTFELIRGWLAQCQEADYQEPGPSADSGSSTPDGFHLIAKEWSGGPYCALEVRPIWCHHPK